MPKPLLFIAPAMFFASCTTWQYATVSSSSVRNNEKLEFIVENDSLQLVYNFNGANAPVNITMHNKLTVPMYIDWQRSAIIVNEKAISYVPEQVQIAGSFNGATSTYHVPFNQNKPSVWYPYRTSVTSGAINASADVPEQLAFVPPQTYITKTPIGITNELMYAPDTAWHKIKFTLVEGTTVPVKKATFTESTSPLKFRSYLTLIVGENTGKPVVYEHNFYISQLLTTTYGPGSIWMVNAYRGNQFYIAGSLSPTYTVPPSGKPNVSQ